MNISTDHPSSSDTTEEGAEHGHAPTPDAAGGAVHLPPTSLWPITLAFGITIMASSLVLNLFMVIPGILLFVLALHGWAEELLHGGH
jgi:Cytochrome c oxidase subunit IV